MNEIRRPKVLLSTAFWPTKTPYFRKYSEGVTRQLLNSDRIYVDVFITTQFAQWKTFSIAGAMHQAALYAIENDYTHYFNVDADVCLGEHVLTDLLKHKEPIVIGNPHGSMSGDLSDILNTSKDKCGWMIMLVETSVLKEVPLLVPGQDPFEHCDFTWYKKIQSKGYKIWVDKEINAEQMDMSPNENFCFGKSFEPKGR